MWAVTTGLDAVAVLLPMLVSIGPIAARQPARIGRLPLLAPLPASRVSCLPMRITSALGRQGIAAMVSARDSGSGRGVIVGTGASFELRSLTVMMGTTVGARHEGESVHVLFMPGGRVVGSRSATTGGTPARLSEDRHAGLFPGDSVQAIALAKAVLKRCRT